MALEKRLETKCKKLVAEHKGMFIKLLPFIIGGLPDRICILPHRPMFFVELKREGKKARRLQTAIHKILIKLGQAVYVVDDYEDFKVILLKHLNLPVYDFRATSESEV